MALESPKLHKAITTLNYGLNKMVPENTSPIPSIDGEIHVCSKCITLHPTLNSLLSHFDDCKITFEPIYQEESIKIAKIGDLRTKQLLSLLGMLFIKRKTLFFEVNSYDYFIVYDQEILGYFSRNTLDNNALSCLMVWPCFQKQGLGTLLIDYSQIKTFQAQNLNPPGPEKPFSKKAIFAYRKYWKYKVIGAKTIKQISEEKNITIDDAIIGLELNGFDFNTWKLKNEKIEVQKPRLLSKKVYRKSNTLTE